MQFNSATSSIAGDATTFSTPRQQANAGAGAPQELPLPGAASAPSQDVFEALSQDLRFEILSRCRPADAARFAAASRGCREAAADSRLPEAWGPRLQEPLKHAGLSVPASVSGWRKRAGRLREKYDGALSSFRNSKFNHQFMVDASLQLCGAPNCLQAVWSAWSLMKPHAEAMDRYAQAAEAIGLPPLPREPYVAVARAIARTSQVPRRHQQCAASRFVQGPEGLRMSEEAQRDLERSLRE